MTIGESIDDNLKKIREAKVRWCIAKDKQHGILHSIVRQFDIILKECDLWSKEIEAGSFLIYSDSCYLFAILKTEEKTNKDWHAYRNPYHGKNAIRLNNFKWDMAFEGDEAILMQFLCEYEDILTSIIEKARERFEKNADDKESKQEVGLLT